MGRSPRASLKRVYWDSCSWIALIGNEKIGREDRGALCRAIIDLAEKYNAEICTSALTLAEVNKHPSTDSRDGVDKLKDFFENDYIIIIPLDRRVGELARDYMQRGYPGLKPLDATHVASASIANVHEMHTFDQKLLNLDGKIDCADGSKLKICKPSTGGPPLPLLETRSSDDDANLLGDE